MSSDFPCSQCGRPLQGGGSPGTKILCPGCGAFTAVPQGLAAPPSSPDAAIEFRCTGCNKLLRTPATTAGKQAKCPDCGTVLPVPMPGTPSADAGPAPPPPPPAGSPFGSQGPVPAPPPGNPFASPDASADGDPENPYQAPTQYGQAPEPSFGTSEAMAAGRVAGPATALLVAIGITIPLQLLGLALNLFGVGMGAAGGPGQDAFPAMLSGGVSVVFTLISLGIGVVIIIGALKMKRLESYSFAMAASILAMIPYLSPCCCLGLPFGIWALVVLNDPNVKAAFRG